MIGLAAGLLVLVSCQPDTELNSLWQFDSFQQSRMNAVDLLVVIDNSCSMVEEQDNLARNFDALIGTFEDADVDWRIAVTTTDVEEARYRGLLVGGDDELVLRGPAGEIDRIEYDRRWAFEPGTALALSGDKLRFSLNDAPSNWCAASASYAQDHLGTPGERNPSCETGQPVEVTPGTDAGPRAPTAGNLVVSEIMATSAERRATCEWVELTNTTPDTLDLTGVVLRDMGRNRFTFPDGVQVGPHEALVVGRASDPAETCGAPVDVSAGDDLVLMDDIRYLDRTTPHADELFGEMVAQGTQGTGIEMGFENARLVLTEYAEENGPWLRDDASLALLFVSDEEDASPHAVDHYVQVFNEVKGDRGHREDKLVTLSAVVGKDPPPRDDVPACENDNGVAWYGKRYLAAANATGGLAESICAEDFAPIVTNLGLTLSGLALEFELSTLPDLETLTVDLYEGATSDTFVRALERDVDYSYVFEGNKIRFEEEQVPPSEYYIVAEYRQLPSGATLTGDTGADE